MNETNHVCSKTQETQGGVDWRLEGTLPAGAEKDWKQGSEAPTPSLILSCDIRFTIFLMQRHFLSFPLGVQYVRASFCFVKIYSNFLLSQYFHKALKKMSSFEIILKPIVFLCSLLSIFGWSSFEPSPLFDLDELQLAADSYGCLQMIITWDS